MTLSKPPGPVPLSGIRKEKRNRRLRLPPNSDNNNPCSFLLVNLKGYEVPLDLPRVALKNLTFFMCSDVSR
jgi:hypothetical protein